ncbi:DUF7151 family protein [Photobacterium sp. DNB23_23_1]
MQKYGYVAIVASLIMSGCGGSSDSPPPSTSTSTLIKTSVIQSSDTCPNGGLEIAVGTDLNGNGILDKNEISGYQTICNGSVGNESLIDINYISPGNSCPNGGSKFSIGIDLNGDGKLSESETTETSFMCNSSASTGNYDYAFLIRIRGEGPGESCEFGGSVVLVGADNNRNGILDNNEIVTQHYTCYNQNPDGNTPPDVPELTVFNTVLNTPKSGSLIADDAENDRLIFIITQAPRFGELTSFSSLTGEFTYQPSVDFVGNDQFFYIADDGQSQSSQGQVYINVSDVDVPSGHFSINTNNIQFVDYPDGLIPRTYVVGGINSDNSVTANLPSPAAISALNLQNLADREREEEAISPSVNLILSNLPRAAGTTQVEVTLVDGPDLERAQGERQVTFSYAYDWISDGNNLSVKSSKDGEATATYFTSDGELAVKLKLDNNSDIFSVDNGNRLIFNVASLFDDDQLGTALSPGVMRDGSYSYFVTFSDFPVVDSYGNYFDSFRGRFNVTRQPVPITQNVTKSLEVRQGQLIQVSAMLSGYGGTGPLTYALVDGAITGGVTLAESSEGKVIYAPLSANLLIDDAFSYQVNDGFLDSNLSKVRLNITDDTATESASLKSIYDSSTSAFEVSWIDKWTDEFGFRVEKYNASCECWETEELLAASPESGLPITWTRNVSESSYYRVFVLKSEGEALLKPAVLVANADYQPSIIYDQSLPIEGMMIAQLDSPSPIISTVDWYVDFTHKCTTNMGGNWTEPSCQIDTTRIADGIHSILARVKMQDSSYVDIESSFSSYNPETPVPSVSQRVHTGSSSSTTPDIGHYEIQVSASDDSGISFVELSMDDMAPVRLTEPNSTWYRSQNYCYIYPQNCVNKNAYTWAFNNLIPGSHSYSILIESNRGEVREVSSKVNVPILIDLLSPSEADISGDSLRILGNIGITNNPVRITVTLGSLTVLDTTGTSFDTTVDMRSVAAGNYTLRITVKDVVGGASSTLTKTLTYTK